MMKYMLLFAIIFVSCAPRTELFYQVFDTASDEVKFNDNDYYYENDDLKISYDLFHNYGDPGFEIYNKTNNPIYLLKDESYYVRNDTAFDYYKNIEFTEGETSNSEVSYEESKSYNTSLSKWNTTKYSDYDGKHVGSVYSGKVAYNYGSQKSMTYIEKKVIAIPAKSKKSIHEYPVCLNRYYDEDFLEYPSKDEVEVKQFSKDKSPYVFYNIISYSMNTDLSNPKVIKNTFWVTEVINLPFDSFYTNIGTNSYYNIIDPNFKSKKKFYIEYFKKMKISGKKASQQGSKKRIK